MKSKCACRFIVSGIALALLLSLSPAWAQTAREQARAVHKASLSAYVQTRDAAKAREGFTAASKLDPTYPDAPFNLGILAEAEEKWDEALRHFAEVKRIAPGSTLATRADKEIALVRRIQLQDKTPAGRKKRLYNEKIAEAKSLFQAGLPKMAILSAAAASKIDDTRWEAYALTASALSAQAEWKEAHNFLQLATKRAPANKQALLQAAIAQCSKELQYKEQAQQGAGFLEMKDYPNAATRFQAAWQLFPERGEYGIAAAVCMTMTGDYIKASEVLTTLRGSKDPSVAREARRLLGKLGSRGAVTPPKSAADVSAEKGTEAAQESEWTKAEAEYRASVAKEPAEPRWHSLLAFALSKQKRWADAEASYREAVRLDASNAKYRSNYAAVLMQLSKWQEAAAQYSAATKIDPNNAANFDYLGTALLQAGDKASALAAYKEAVRLAPDKAQYQTDLKNAGG